MAIPVIVVFSTWTNQFLGKRRLESPKLKKFSTVELRNVFFLSEGFGFTTGVCRLTPGPRNAFAAVGYLTGKRQGSRYRANKEQLCPSECGFATVGNEDGSVSTH